MNLSPKFGVIGSIIGLLTIAFIINGLADKSRLELALEQLGQHKLELVQHEKDCEDLKICLEAELSYSETLDSCYPIDPLWGWPGEKSESLLTTCKLFKRIRRVSGQ